MGEAGSRRAGKLGCPGWQEYIHLSRPGPGQDGLYTEGLLWAWTSPPTHRDETSRHSSAELDLKSQTGVNGINERTEPARDTRRKKKVGRGPRKVLP